MESIHSDVRNEREHIGIAACERAHGAVCRGYEQLAMAAACACAIQVHAVVAAAAPANSPERGYLSASPIELWQLETVLVNLFIL